MFELLALVMMFYELVLDGIALARNSPEFSARWDEFEAKLEESGFIVPEWADLTPDVSPSPSPSTGETPVAASRNASVRGAGIATVKNADGTISLAEGQG